VVNIASIAAASSAGRAASAWYSSIVGMRP
jgi:hypothetical protein